jgi:hypothetical protein
MLDYDRCHGTGKAADSNAAGGRVATTGATGTVGGAVELVMP